jgi:D-alanyl-D-alanine carboxypeptidase/D-alanyl-D-alanine-endopeptidase (penicillin-binding protein 4)
MKKTLITLAALLLSLTLSAQDATTLEALAVDSIVQDTLAIDTLPYPQNIRQRLDSLTAHSRTLRTSQLGLMVYDLTADSAIYTYNHRQTMRPASTMKLVTAIAAIDRLGGSYQLRTSLYYKGRIADGTLTGDLYCVGGMDPRFDGDDLRAFVESVRRLNVDTIRGKIVADRSFKEEELLGEGWCWDDDNPVLTPLLFGRKDNFVERFVDRLRESGITVDVTMTEGTLPTQGVNRICSRTHSIEQVLHKMMKESDNLYAECIFFQLAAAEGQRPAKAKSGANAIKRLIQRVGLAPSNYRIADGSGLSLYNYVSPELMTRLLRYAWRNKNISDCLLPTLPIAGVDGTLKGRMQKTAAYDNVHAKTGTLTGISSLAGYCTAANGHELCFAIINQGVMRNSDGRNFQDQVCTALCK